MVWFGGTLKMIPFQLPAQGRDTWARQLQMPSIILFLELSNNRGSYFRLLCAAGLEFEAWEPLVVYSAY